MDDPKIAISVIVEHGGHGGGAAAPIAKDIIETLYRESHKPKVIPVKTQQEGLENSTANTGGSEGMTEYGGSENSQNQDSLNPVEHN